MVSNREEARMEPRICKPSFGRQTQNRDMGQDPKKLRQILKVCDLKQGQRVLNVAFGTGALIPWLMERRPSLLMGIDISDGMTQIARKEYRDRRLRIVTADYFHIEAGAFDRIIVFNAYPHFPDKERFAAKTFSLLAPGGRFVVAHSRDEKSSGCGVCGECGFPLRPAAEEKRWFEPYFDVDCFVSTDDIYILSGTKG